MTSWVAYLLTVTLSTGALLHLAAHALDHDAMGCGGRLHGGPVVSAADEASPSFACESSHEHCSAATHDEDSGSERPERDGGPSHDCQVCALLKGFGFVAQAPTSFDFALLSSPCRVRYEPIPHDRPTRIPSGRAPPRSPL